MLVNNLDTYDKAKEWLGYHVDKVYFSFNRSEFSLLSDLLNRHPDKNKWVNQTPLSFKISRSPGNNALVMYVKFEGMKNYRIVSWVACSTGKVTHQQSDDNMLNGAMRYAIRKQVNNYKALHPIQICAICQSQYRIELDHFPKHFVQIKEDFINMKLSKEEPAPTEFKWHPKKGNFMFKNGTKSNNYYDKKWKMSWQAYHNKHAEYRYLCSTCNKKTNQIIPTEKITTEKIAEKEIKKPVLLIIKPN